MTRKARRTIVLFIVILLALAVWSGQSQASRSDGETQWTFDIKWGLSDQSDQPRGKRRVIIVRVVLYILVPASRYPNDDNNVLFTPALTFNTIPPIFWGRISRFNLRSRLYHVFFFTAEYGGDDNTRLITHPSATDLGNPPFPFILRGTPPMLEPTEESGPFGPRFLNFPYETNWRDR